VESREQGLTARGRSESISGGGLLLGVRHPALDDAAHERAEEAPIGARQVAPLRDDHGAQRDVGLLDVQLGQHRADQLAVADAEARLGGEPAEQQRAQAAHERDQQQRDVSAGCPLNDWRVRWK
jgi:hypothetical protein